MLETFSAWWRDNSIKITWFIIGAMIMSGLIYFGQGQWFNAVICFAIAGANWYWNGR